MGTLLSVELEYHFPTSHEQWARFIVVFLAHAEIVRRLAVHERIWQWMMGIEGVVRSSRTHRSEANRLRLHTSLVEGKREKIAIWLMAILLIAFGLFTHLYWSANWMDLYNSFSMAGNY